MKPIDVKYNQEQLDNIKRHPVMRDNFDNLLKDFETHYVGFLNQDFPLQEEQLSQLKGDLLTAFAFGATAACDMNSHFRLGFRIPEELVFKKEEKKIIMPDQTIIDPSKKIIL